MRKILDFCGVCILGLIYAIFLSIAFTYNSILFLPLASIIIIIAIIIGLFCFPVAIAVLIIWCLVMIARSIIDVNKFRNKKSKF